MRIRPRLRLALLGVVTTAILATGCGSSSSTATTTSTGPTGSITVSAASSLTAAFTVAKAEFEAQHPGTTITVNFGASSTLAQQISDGAPVDVFASADNANMQKAVDAKDISGSPVTFTTNSLEILVGRGNPGAITGITDLGRPGLIYVTCAPEVPIGKYSAQALAKAGVAVAPSSLEPDVKGIVTKVTSGEADAGIVYATDVTAAGDKAAGVSIPSKFNVVASYPIAITASSTNVDLATAWIAFITGADGQRILTQFGFVSP